MAVTKKVKSVRRARRALLEAIRAERRNYTEPSPTLPHSWFVAARERAVRDLIASVRAECGK